jgi:hypothetical protein
MIKTLWQNKHTSGAALAYIAAKAISGLGAIWFPQHKDQFEQTANLVESLAVGYGLIMAGDAKPTAADSIPK